MKKTFNLLTLVIMAVMMLPGALRAQEIPALPADPGVRIGTLPNGLTYYLRHNEYPKGQADFYIAQKVGSIQEDDNQRGLAHFLEHMCFNGTTHFPGSSMIDWLNTKGVKFGVNLNAYTDIDETVYNISNVPVTNVAVQDSCLLILHDWANDLLLDGEEIDKERGVIHEEWRSRNVGQQRILEQLLPTLYPTSKYAYRMPIGTMEIVDNFPHKALRDYYEKWYRPELQGIIVVGDIDVDRVEGKIKEMFADIPATKNGATREYYPVPDHEGTIYAIGADKEQQYNIGQIMWLSDPLPNEYRNTAAFYQVNFIQDMIDAMLSNRFNDILSKPDAPFGTAFANFGGYLLSRRTKDAFSVGALAGNDGDITTALAAAYREVLRAARGGFTQSEYDRVKTDLLSRWESRFNNRETRENETFVNAYVRNFLDGNPIPGIDIEYMIAQQLAAAVPLEMINESFKQMITPDNRVVLVMCVDNASTKIPTEAQLKDALAAVDGENIEAYKEEVRTDPLIPAMPAAGRIVGEETLDQFGAQKWQLSNGATVIVKPTKFKEDQIIFKAQALDGYAGMNHRYDPDIILGQYSFDSFGLGAYNNNDLRKYLSGKVVSLTPDFDSSTRTVVGSSTPKDLQTLMELIYMLYTNATYDAEEFAALQSQINSLLQHQATQPQFVFNQRMLESLYDSPRQRMITPEIASQATAQKTQELVRGMLANPADFTFTFVGNVDPEALRPLVEQYIASIPGMPGMAVRNIREYDRGSYVKAGSGTDRYTTKMETPTTYVAIVETADLPYDAREAMVASVAGQILSKRLLKTVREDMNAVYSISAAGSERRLGPANAMIQTAFPMKPELRDQVLDFISGEIKNMEKNVTADELDPVKEYLIKDYTEAKDKNEGWMGAISGWLNNGVDSFNPAIDNISSITVADVMDFMKKLNAQKNYRVVILEAE